MTSSPGEAAQQNPKEDSEALGQLIESDLFAESSSMPHRLTAARPQALTKSALR